MKIPYFDAHCDTLSRMAYLPGAHLERRTGQWDLEKLSRFDGPKAQIFAVFYDSALPGASRAAERQIAVFCRECERNQDRVVSCVDASRGGTGVCRRKTGRISLGGGGGAAGLCSGKAGLGLCSGRAFYQPDLEPRKRPFRQSLRRAGARTQRAGKGLCPAYGTARNAA